MFKIECLKIGTKVNLSINGKLYQKVCDSLDEANELFKKIVNVNSSQTKENVDELRTLFNEKRRIASIVGFEYDPETNESYLKGFNTPIPNLLFETIKDYQLNNYPINPIINFWKLLMLNPDKRIRTRLFDFMQNHDFVLTDKGYLIVYKAVFYKKNKKPINDLSEFVTNQYLHVKKDWKTSPYRYIVYRQEGNGQYKITKSTTTSSLSADGVKIFGNLGDLYDVIINDKNNDTAPLYTDMFSRTMTIKVGEPVIKLRSECDGDPEVECSYGLHVGSTKYVEHYASNYNSSNDPVTILVCFVNPANVVAVPNHDLTKMRVTEYFPFAVASYNDGKIDIIEHKYFEDDYCNYEFDNLQDLLAKAIDKELPIETALNSTAETRPMSELIKIINNRLVELNNLKS